MSPAVGLLFAEQGGPAALANGSSLPKLDLFMPRQPAAANAPALSASGAERLILSMPSK